jgi:hypothetical protein
VVASKSNKLNDSSSSEDRTFSVEDVEDRTYSVDDVESSAISLG